MNANTIYEFPLNERIRVFMRLEQSFQQLNHFMGGNSVFDKRAAISTLLEILTILGRSDLKSEIIKELDRHAKVLGQLVNSQGVDVQKLQEILADINLASRNLYTNSGKIGGSVLESDLLQSIAKRNAIEGGSCSFDLPAYHYWLEQDETDQQKDLERWTQPFAEIRGAIDMILGFIRLSNMPKSQVALSGFFQSTLDRTHPAQLLRVTVPSAVKCFAEISGSKHRFSIRFMQPSTNGLRPTQTPDDIDFSLTCCAI